MIMDQTSIFAQHTANKNIHVTSEEKSKLQSILGVQINVSVDTGSTVTCTNGVTTLTATAINNECIFYVPSYDTWTISAKKDSLNSNTIEVVIDTVKKYNIALSYFSATITVTVDSGSTVTCSCNDIIYTATSNGTAVFTVHQAGTWAISASLNDNTADGTVDISSNGESKSLTLSYVHIYGVQWDGTSTTSWARTDDSVDFIDPVPAISGGTGSSPFDNCMPWSGMIRVTDSVAGELVAIPKFWYKWTKSGNTMKLQIADKSVSGFYVSPAHADRGDGKGERDIVYVGRYHCVSGYKSTSGSSPQVNITRSTARSGIHSLGSTIWQFDFAMRWTIQMLYLVEFADWNSQTKIGYGCGNSSSYQNVGSSDSMKYHTGTMQSSRTTYGVGVQYRYIEGLWDNVYDWMDGCYYNSSGLNVIMNPNNFSDSSNGTAVGSPPGGWTSAFSIPTKSGFEWALYPSATSGSGSTYITDCWGFDSSCPCLCCGGCYDQGQDHGLFCVGYLTSSFSGSGIGCRLQKLP